MNNQETIEKKLTKAFQDIIDRASDEDYEQCAAVALEFLNEFKNEVEAIPFIPYAKYFKLFSEAYRTWQISYNYTPIRSRFGLAYYVLNRGLKTEDDKILCNVFEKLSQMLCAYTRCENSFINNDPFALKVNAEKALEYEDEISNNEELKLISLRVTNSELEASIKKLQKLDEVSKSKELQKVILKLSESCKLKLKKSEVEFKTDLLKILDLDETRLQKTFSKKSDNELQPLTEELIEHLKRLKSEIKKENRSPFEDSKIKIARWLLDYFKTNWLLHFGLKVCAESYIIILQEQRPLKEGEEIDNFNDLEKKVEELRERSAELSSELNAHIRHIKSHNELLKLKKTDTNKISKSPTESKPEFPSKSAESRNTFLAIKKGFLVNQVSVAFDSDLAHELFSNNKLLEKFRKNLEAAFGKLGVEVSGFQLKQIHDVFQTSFGKQTLQTMSFDLWKKKSKLIQANASDDREDADDGKEIKVRILNADYYFDLSFSLSALGVCTLYFKLKIDKLKHNDKEKDSLRKTEGLRVEEARTLQSLLCPHAGQVEITDVLAGDAINDFGWTKRIELPELIEDVKSLKKGLKNLTFKNTSLKNELDNLENAFKQIEESWLSQVKDNEIDDDSDSNTELVSKALKELTELSSKFDELKNSNFKKKIDEISKKLDRYYSAAHLAEQYLGIIGTALTESLKKSDFWDNVWEGIWQKRKPVNNILKPAFDTGWFTYLYCRSIDEVKLVRNRVEVVKKLADFNEIANHPDMQGFVIEQREARASFDDWRFLKHFDSQNDDLVPINLQEKNLAHIRSHETDGFFCTEYQAFIYFPDDPMFLTDQYEATVKLMVRLSTVLRFISVNARKLAENIHSELHAKGQKLKTKELSNNLDDIRWLRLHAKEIQATIARAGISRYKDHGDLLKRIMIEMKLDQLVDLIDQQLQHLSDLYDDALRKLDEKRESKRTTAILLLTATVGFSAGRDLVDSIFQVGRFKGFFKYYLNYFINFLFSYFGSAEVNVSDDAAKGILTLILVGSCFVLLLIIIFKWRRN